MLHAKIEEFPPSILLIVAERVALRCSNPQCRTVTREPTTHHVKPVNAGVGAHIESAHKGDARYNPTLPAALVKAAENAIWLCHNCARIIDSDPAKYTAEHLRAWKDGAEAEAAEKFPAHESAEKRKALIEKVFEHAVVSSNRPHGFQHAVQDTIDTYAELRLPEKAEIFERVHQQRTGFEAQYNPYMGICHTCVRKIQLLELTRRTVTADLISLGDGFTGNASKTVEVCRDCASPAEWPQREQQVRQEILAHAKEEGEPHAAH